MVGILNIRSKRSAEFPPFAVIELFTSQGCSSCPSADKLLQKTIQEANGSGKKIFALSFHVDYWNRLGWIDPFSNKQFSERQSRYASTLRFSSIYTPQMIVNGNSEFVGSSTSNLELALATAFNSIPRAGFKMLKLIEQRDGILNVKFEIEGDFNADNIHFALVSLTETTSVKRGENGGRMLSNENVVRQFITLPAKAKGEIDFEKQPAPEGTNSAVIAYIQDLNMKIVGAAMTKVSN